MIEKTKLKYESPRMEVYELRQPQLLQSSGGTTPYDPQSPETW